MEVFIGMIMPVAFNYAPRYWLPCDGRLLPVNQYNALFSVIGARYGGDGIKTFALPDLRGRIGVGFSQAALGIGNKIGANTVSVNVRGIANLPLTEQNLASHVHQVDIPAEQLVATSTLRVTTAGGVAQPVKDAALGVGSSIGGGQALIYVKDGIPTVPLQADTVKTTLAAVSVTTASPQTVPAQTEINVQATLSTVQPSLGVNFVICVNGLYPSKP